MSAIPLHSFTIRGLEFKAFWMPESKTWFVQNHRVEFDFPGTEDIGLGKVKASLKKVLRDQYRYLLDNASRVIVRMWAGHLPRGREECDRTDEHRATIVRHADAASNAALTAGPQRRYHAPLSKMERTATSRLAIATRDAAR